VLDSKAAGYATSAALILQAAEDLRALAVDGSSKALEGIRTKSAETATQLDEAHTRYAGTATALQVYSVKLRAAQVKADRADQARAWAQHEVKSANESSENLRRRYESLRDADAPMGTIAAAQEEWLQAGQAVRRLQASASEATSIIETARQEVDTAAREAINAINSALKGTNDSGWDKIKKFFEDVGDFLSSIAAWVGEVLKKILDVIVEVLKIVAVALLVIAAILLVVAALIAIVHLLVAIVTSAVFWIILALLSAAVAAIFLWEFTRPDLKIEQLTDASSLDGAGQQEAFSDAIDHGEEEVSSLGDIAESMLFVDKIGAEQTSIIDIKNMGGEPPHWVVTIPSTQALMGGAANDWPHNVPLKFWPPELLTKYEEAVRKAMATAGIGPNDPVMVQGFSQGGIMAARLAANSQSGFNITGVLTVGSPVHDIYIPAVSRTGDPVHVVTVQHQSDPVPALSNPFVRHDETHPNWRSFTEPDPPGDHLVNAHTTDGTATNYVRTLEKVIERNPELSSGDDAPFKAFYGKKPQEHKIMSLTE